MHWVRQLVELCRARGGAVHVGVAAARLDVPPRRIRELAQRQGWWRPHRDVVAPPGVPRSARLRAAAAVAQVRGPSPAEPRPCAVAGWSAAALWGVGPGAPSRTRLVVPAARGPRFASGLVVERSRTFDPAAVLDLDGLPVVAPPWLVRSCAPLADVEVLTDLVIDLVQRRHVRLDEVAAEHARYPRYPGRPRVAAVLARLGGAGRADSGLELRTRERLLAAGVPLDVGQVAVPCGRSVLHLDLGIAAIRFGIELDSMLAHSTRPQLRADVRRGNALATAAEDWRIVRATWEDLGPGWADFLDLVRRVVGRQSQRHLGVPWPRPQDVGRG